MLEYGISASSISVSFGRSTGIVILLLLTCDKKGVAADYVKIKKLNQKCWVSFKKIIKGYFFFTFSQGDEARADP
jgi:hypothetical protein